MYVQKHHVLHLRFIIIIIIIIITTTTKSSQVTVIYIALLTIQIVSKHLTVSSWRIECQ